MRTQSVINVRPEDLLLAGRLALSARDENREGVAAVLQDCLDAADGGDTQAATGLILGLAKLLSIELASLDRATGGKASAGIRTFIAEAILTLEAAKEQGDE